MGNFYPVQVMPIEGFRLFLTFDNGEYRIFNVAPYLVDAYFAPLINPIIFNSVKISPVSVEWDSGIDICPDELYNNSVLVHQISKELAE